MLDLLWFLGMSMVFLAIAIGVCLLVAIATLAAPVLIVFAALWVLYMMHLAEKKEKESKG